MSTAVQPLTTIRHVTPRVDAIARVTGQAKYTNDLKLPGMNGLQLLKWIRTKRELRLIPVVVLTGSADTTQVQAAYEAGANSYLLKPADRSEIIRVVELLEHYWVQHNVPPPLVRRAHENL